MRGLLTAFCGLLIAAPAAAGPPLLTDDPQAVNHRRLELIWAANGTERGDSTTFGATLLDVAYGLIPGLEIDVSFDLTHSDRDEDDDKRFEYGGAPALFGLKWEMWERGGFLASAAPNLSFDVDDGDNLAGGFPLLAQYDWGRFRLGAEGGYVLRDDARDGWKGGVFAGLGVGTKSELLAEVYAGAFEDRHDPEVGWNAGVDLALSARVHLLASGGTGLYSGAGSTRGWTGYLGLQLLLGPFHSAEDQPPERTKAPPGSLAQSRLLDLTDRQLSRQLGQLLDAPHANDRSD